TFDSQLSLNTPVVVPCGMVETYEDADFWYNFRRIRQAPGCGQTYTLTVLSSNNAWGTATGGGIYVDGTTATLTATANEGYTFSNWSDGSTENPHDVVVMADATYIATFVQGGSSNPTVYNSIEATACGSYTWNDHTYTESGEYQQTFTAANSADSIVTLTLTINPAPQPQITLYGELDACNPSSVAFATEQYQSYQWSNGATTMITSTSVPGYYYVEVTGENGCSGISEQVCIGVSNAITEAPQISVVGMNSENHNVVAWSALDNANVNAYRIYRENNVANVYEPMATVEALQTTWTDSTADPTARAYRYKVTAVDECGGESPMSDYHKTMHLTINQGIGNTWNLIWSHYEGFNFGTYRIYRGTSPSNMTMIGEVPSNLNSYTDNTATDNTGFYYQVEVVRNTRSRDAEISSRSNIVDNGIFPEYTITVMSANTNRGTVTGGGTYPEGTVITIEAIANEGFEFASWSDENTDNPRQITVTADATYIATFDEVSSVTEYTITVMSSNPNRGTVTGGGTYAEGTVVRIEATALEGFVFSSWSDENTDNPRYITVTGDATYIASFDPATGIEGNTAFEINLFPNPANDILNISSSETISEIEIVNTLGQVVKRIEVNSDNAVCDVEELKAGVYVVRIRTASATLSQRKFIKE
ncbi:MAG: T9SS type A sorting domain-containing protein, partial [Bacteroidales bacterium]|nr:T9SS type A sorting domain-containing protein [Bacteroidales bacterium]